MQSPSQFKAFSASGNQPIKLEKKSGNQISEFGETSHSSVSKKGFFQRLLGGNNESKKNEDENKKVSGGGKNKNKLINSSKKFVSFKNLSQFNGKKHF